MEQIFGLSATLAVHPGPRLDRVRINAKDLVDITGNKLTGHVGNFSANVSGSIDVIGVEMRSDHRQLAHAD